MEVDDEIEAGTPETRGQGEVISETTPTARALDDDDLIQMGVAAHDGFGYEFHKIRNPGVREALPQRRNRRRREDDVANEPQPDEQDLQGSTVASSISITGMSSLIG